MSVEDTECVLQRNVPYYHGQLQIVTKVGDRIMVNAMYDKSKIERVQHPCDTRKYNPGTQYIAHEPKDCNLFAREKKGQLSCLTLRANRYHSRKPGTLSNHSEIGGSKCILGD
jgi:hypothetical protein